MAETAGPQAVTPLFAPPPEIEEPVTEPYVRSPADLLRLVAGAIVVLLGLLVSAGISSAAVGFDRDLQNAFGSLPDIVETVLITLFQVVAALIPVVVFGLVLVRRRFRLFGMLLLAGFTSMIVLGAVNEGVLALFGEPRLLQDIEQPGAAARGSADSVYLTWLVAVITVASPWIKLRWRRAAWGMVVLALLFRIFSGTDLPSDLVLALGIGMVSGSAWLLVFGAPNHRPSGVSIAAAMERTGFPLSRLKPASVDARSSAPYFGECVDGSPIFMKILSPDNRDKNLLFRLYRFLRFKGVDDRGAFVSLQRLIEHEALVALYVNDGGIRTPRLLTVTDVGDDGFLLAYQRIKGDSLDGVEDEALTDDMLRQVWQEVRQLRRQRIAHRDLRLSNVFLASDGRPWMIDFGSGEMAATDLMLDMDVAELLASTALKVGPKRAVDPAVEVLGKTPIAKAAPHLQPLALTRATSNSLAAKKPLVRELREYAAQASGAGSVEPVDLQRVKPRTILTFAALALATYLLVPQLVGVAAYWPTLTQADWIWGLWAIVASGLCYVAGAFALKGAVPSRIPLFSTIAAKLAGAFFNRITPATLGGMGITVRFLQKRGIDLAVATTAAGLQTITAALATIALAVVFLAWAGTEGSVTSLLPSTTMLITMGAVLAALGVFLLLPFGRRLFRTRVAPILKRSGQGMADVARRPYKLAELVGGQLTVTLLYIVALAFSVQALGGGVSLATIAVIYLLGTTAASAVPTPGGIGTVEVALIAGLRAAGMPSEEAVPAVFLYRLATFWLPILPGYLAYVVLQRREAL
jgi:glycosyltransferase 2 family protein